MEIIGWLIQQRAICNDTWGRKTILKRLQNSMSLNYTFPESSVAQENNKLPRGPTNSYKCQRDFSNVLCKQQFLLDGASQRSKLYYLTQSFVPNQCSNSSSWSYFMICGPEKAEITKAVSLRSSRNDRKMLAAIFHSLVTAKGSLGQTDKLKMEEKKSGCSRRSLTFRWSLSSSARQAQILHH